MTPSGIVQLGAALLAFSAQACAAGLPLLHPAQPLPPGVTSFASGVGSYWVGGQAHRDLETARAQLAASPDSTSEIPPAATFASAVWSPGLFPWLSARIGLGNYNEAGVSYTGRRARLDARHALLVGRWAFSLGLGVVPGLSHPTAFDSNGVSTFGATEALPGLDTSGVRSIGCDLPLLVGWHSSADIARIWLGIRPSYEHGYGTVSWNSSSSSTKLDYQSDVASLTGIAGLAMGLRPLFLALEVSFGDARAHGQLTRATDQSSHGSATMSAYSLTPAASIIWEVR